MLISLLALILAAFSASPAAREESPPAASPAAPVLTGTIAAEKGDAPIAGALVEVLPWLDPDAARARRLAGELVAVPLAAATTDAAGAFRVSVPPQHRVLIAVSAAGHARTRYRGAFLIGEPGEVRDVGRLTLAPGRTLTGKVVAAAGKPVAGATVIAMSRQDGGRARPGGRFARRFAPVLAGSPLFPVTAVSGPDGAFTLNGVSEDSVTVRAHATGLAPAVKRDVRASGIVLSMEAGHSLSGTVVAPDGTTPAAGAWVLAGLEGEEGWDGLARADAKGAFTLKNLRAGSTGITATVATVLAGASDDLPASAHWAPSSPFTGKLPLASGAAPAKLKLRPGSVVRIHAIDSETREPIAGSLLVLDEPGDSQPRPATAGPSGGVTFTGVSAGSVEARGDAAGYLTEEAATVNLPVGERRSLSIALRRASALSGTVRDSEGRPVAGAAVSVAGPPPFAMPMPMAVYFPIGVPPTSTDAAGVFHLEKLPPRTDLQVSVSFEGYVPWEISGIKLRPGERREGLEVLLDLGAVLAGRLLDQEGSPIEGAAVTAEKQREGTGSEMVMMVGGGRRMGAGGPMSRDAAPEVASDETGLFRVRGLKPGIWTLKIKAKGFAPREVGGIKIETAGAGQDTGDIVLAPGGVLRGKVTNAEGNAVGFARGTLRERFTVLSEFTAGPDGHFVTEDMAPGDTFDLNIAADGYATYEKNGLSVPSEDLGIVMVPSSTIRGEVIDEETRQTIEDFSVAVSRTRAVGGGGMQFNMLMPGPERQFQTDDGAFAIEGVDPGSITVRANAPGYKETRLDDLKVPEGADLNGIRLLMSRAASVTGTVLDDRGRPLPNVEVARKQANQGMMMMRTGSAGSNTTTDGDGNFVLSGLERGPMTLSFTHPEFEVGQADVDTSHDVKNLKVTLSRGTDLTGIVIHENDGSPVAGAAVTAVAAGSSRMGQAASAKTGPDGVFALEALSAGRYTVRAEAKGLRPAIADDVVIAPGVQPALVELRVGGGVTLTGTIAGIDPQDLPRFSVSSVRPGGGFGAIAAVDASGRFEMGGMSPGSTTLIARSGILGGRSMARTVEIPDNVTSFETTIEFPRGSVVDGTVTRGGEPLDGASVVFIHTTSRASQTVRTDQAGGYVASDVEDGQYDVTVMHFRSGTTHTTSVSVEGDKRFDIELPLARISGTVTDATTGKPLDGVQINIRKLDGEATSQRMGMLLQRGASTDATGSYALEGLDAGTYSLTASRPGYGYETQQASIIPGVAPPDISFVLGPTEGLSFVAIDAASGMPLRSITGLVLVGGPDPLSPGGSGSPILSGRWSADASGIFHLDSLQPGAYRMVLGGEGLATMTFHDIEVPATGASFTLERGGGLELRAASLKPGQTAMAALVDERGRALHYSTFFPEPGFRLRGGEPTILADLPPGAWRLRVAWPDGRVEETPAAIAPGQVLRITLP